MPTTPITAVPLDGAIAPEPPKSNFSDYLGDLGQTIRASEVGPHLANPGELATQAAKSLRGYVDRAQGAQDFFNNKFIRHGSGPFSANGNGEMHPGPAREPLLSSKEDIDSIDTPGKKKPIKQKQVTDILEESLSQVDALVEFRMFVIESQVVASGAQEVNKSVNTLIKGQ